MSSLALISVIYGILVVVNRLPLVLAPKATTEFYRKLLVNNTGIRIMGVLGTLLGLAMIISAWRSDQSAALIILVFGWLVALASVGLLLLFTSTYKKISKTFLELDPTVHRVFGAVVTGIGFFFIYLGLWVF
jgi:hypothetical protein